MRWFARRLLRWFAIVELLQQQLHGMVFATDRKGGNSRIERPPTSISFCMGERLFFRVCAGFRMPALRSRPHAPTAGVRKAPGHEIAGCKAVRGQQPNRGLWGFEGRAGGGERPAHRCEWVL